MKPPFFTLSSKGSPIFQSIPEPVIFESNLLPEEKEVTERVEWITRNSDGTLLFRHDLRKHGSVYETKTTPRTALFIQGLGIVMRPEDAAAIGVHTSS